MRLFDLSAGGTAAGAGEDVAPDRAEPEAAPSGPLRRVMLLVAYDGSGFHGVAAQPGQRTVAGVIGAALAGMARHPVRIVCAGRTDTGVHALGQVLHADLDQVFLRGWIERSGDLSGLARSLSRQAGPSCAVQGVWEAVGGFDARHSAVARRYRYRILPGLVEDPLRRGVVWQTESELDLRPMRLAADAVLGEHDFSAFCKRPEGHAGPLPRRVLAASLLACGDELQFFVEANAFCHHMVRSIVGALVSVGEGRMTAADMVEILRTGDRARGSRKAPAGGLCLMEVRYPEELVPGGVLRRPG